MPHSIWRVALPVAGAEAYDYLAPSTTPGKPIGHAVEVPFGRRRLVGLVTETTASSPVPANKLRAVHRVLQDAPVFDPATFAMLKFAAQHYQHPLGLCIATALPPGLFKPQRPAASAWMITEAGRAAVHSAPGKRQRELLAKLVAHSRPQTATAIGATSDALRRMQAHGWIEAEAAVEPLPGSAPTVLSPIELRADQQRCADTIAANEGYACHLLIGPTGSGKTEIYLERAAAAVDQGQQVLMLVPEIALTPQMETRIRSRLAARIGVLHSQLAGSARRRLWQAAQAGELDFVLATRSGVFIPLPRLGLVIVDEEHDASYKQQDGMRYSARDLAVYRARQQNCTAILGSATPALESLRNAREGRYSALKLEASARGQYDLGLIDMRPLPRNEPLSPPLVAAIRTHLAKDGQVFLFLNRRGYAPVLYCNACGWSAPCPRCDSRLVLHQPANELRCHQCDSRRHLPRACGDCGAEELLPVGWGTQRVMESLQQHFPDVAILRFDRDSLKHKGDLETALEAIHSNQARIVVGTQMLAKGHDFPHLSLVGVIDADSSLYSSDFRAPERFGQLLTQVSGRAGRRAQDAQCLIQTRNSTHPYLQTWMAKSYAGLAKVLDEERHATGWPPHSHLALLRIEAAQTESLTTFWAELADCWQATAKVEQLGPVMRPRRAGRERAQLLLRSPQRSAIAASLRHLRASLDNAPFARRVRWSLDVDPQSLD